MQRLPKLVVFGPQRCLPNPGDLSRLRLVVLSEPALVAAIKDLPNLWRALLEVLPLLRQVPGPRVFLELKAWIDHGRPLTSSYPHPNVLLTPLSVIADTASYLHYLRVSRGNSLESHTSTLKSVQHHGGFQGLCTGLLTAIAISRSDEESDVGENAAVAIRLAVCIGAIVDLESAFAVPPDEACCLAVRFRSAGKPTVLKILQDFPGAYISVVAGEIYMTVTASKAVAPMLMQQLASSGSLVKIIETGGRYHTPRHKKALKSILDVCNHFPGLKFPHMDNKAALASTTPGLNLPTTTGDHESALNYILTRQADWHATLTSAVARLEGESADVLAVGKVNFLPRATMKEIQTRLSISYLQAFEFHEPPEANVIRPESALLERMPTGQDAQRVVSENDVAIIGMSCYFPGASSLEEYWQLLCEGKSMHKEVPNSRLSRKDLDRTEGSSQTYWGNFLNNVEDFDHHFFNMSPREAESMDPQQRIALQVAYEAIESSGYFDELPSTKSVGCFLGVGSVDYQDNVASHPPTAFSALGTLRAFISGKISHHFGWEGPSITCDSACSSSAVAIHTACKAIRAGECSQALAGGVNIITSPMLYQSLSKAGFLSPNGPCKPFDADADGYCRGEGAGMLVLKNLSAAIADGDSIAGVIAGSAVSQSDNSSPITVPHSKSQIDLYRNVTSLAGTDPSEIGYVEAHGTGTPVGDPIECESIRQVFGDAQRRDMLFLGSVKANIGHTEAASGVAAVIKAVLMMQKGSLPMQANFENLNPKISPLEPNKMSISTRTRRWNGTAVCINNYGAAGSNAAMILRQAPAHQPQQEKNTKSTAWLRKHPILLSAHSESSLVAYCKALRPLLSEREGSQDESPNLADIAFALAHRANRTLSTSIATYASSLGELEAKLLYPGESLKIQKHLNSPKRPNVLCFGGQTKAWIGLREETYQSLTIFRMHLDHCESICRFLGLEGFYPMIFSRTLVEDTVLLQCMLFSIQYACAKSWLDCGLQVNVVIGHSFGQITALCVSGSMSLQQAITMVSGRAKLIESLWGPEKGTMLSIESDREALRQVLSMASQHDTHRVEIACFNSPTTVVLAGSKASIAALESRIMGSSTLSKAMKVRTLVVSHGFHSHLIDPILPGLAEIARSIDFHEPRIRVETCSKSRTWTRIDAEAITQHSREPVYFSEAVSRIVEENGPCNWIEAGTDSGITTMARQALEASTRKKHMFQPISLTSECGADVLADATVNLWQSGVEVQFWPYHRFQRAEYRKVPLPPYQFDKHRHWLEYKERAVPKSAAEQDPSPPQKLLSFISFIRPQNSTQSLAEFGIDPESQDFKCLVQGHQVLGNGSCSASVYIYFAAKAFAELVEGEDPEIRESNFCIEQLEMQSPLGLDTQRMISVSLVSSDHSPGKWSFRVHSRKSIEGVKIADHASGIAYLKPTEHCVTIPDDVQLSHARSQDTGETSIAGSFIYTVFSTVVKYAEYFQGLQRVSSRGTEVTGLVSLPRASSKLLRDGSNAICSPLMIDNFLQVAGVYINCLQGNKPGLVYVCTQIQDFQHHVVPKEQRLGPWGVICHIVNASEKAIICDISACHAHGRSTVATISSARFTRVSATTLTKTLLKTGCYKDSSTPDNDAVSSPNSDNAMLSTYHVETDRLMDSKPEDDSGVGAKIRENPALKKPGSRVDSSRSLESNNMYFAQLRELLQSVTGVPIENMRTTSLFEDIGIDSLMTTEVLGEIENAFDISIAMSDFDKMNDLGSLCSHIERKDPRKFIAAVAPPEPAIKSNVKTSLQGRAPMNAGNDDMNNENSSEGVTMISKGDSTRSDMEVPSSNTLKWFEASEGKFIRILHETQLKGFTEHVFPCQADVVTAYVVEAFEELGCRLSQLEERDAVSVPFIPQHTALMEQLHKILQTSSLIHCQVSGSVRSAVPIKNIPAHEMVHGLLDKFPQNASEHRLLGAMGPHLANFISGKEDPIQLLYGDKATKDLLTDVYTNAPMFATGTRLLKDFLSNSIAAKGSSKPIRILEIGGGVGGTTVSVIELLETSGHPFTYTFTDVSSSLVAAAKKRFAGHDSMDFKVLDIEAEPQNALLKSQDTIIATNVIHATKTLKESCINVRKMLDRGGILCLAELTRNLHWFDLVFGLLDGWWRFEDSRKHAIADIECWDRNLREAGFEHVAWTGDGHDEGDIVRLIVAIAPNEEPNAATHASENLQTTMETVLFKEIDRIPLFADIYYPGKIQTTKSKRPVALLIHGGGHVMLSRKDIRPLQLQHLLSSGLLPISLDHRLCPEVSLISGPMSDLCSALDWARNILPTLTLQRSDIAADGTKVVVVGWSTGGMLAMSLGWTAPARGLKPPEAILALYCPTDYESSWWKKPHFPWRTSQADADRKYDLWDAVRETPITGYNIASARAPGGWMSTLDARARVPLHMNWTAQTLPILLGALTSEEKARRGVLRRGKPLQQSPLDGHSRLPQPSGADVKAISPLAQIRLRHYRTPTYLIHGSEDDFIPWEETQRTYNELAKRGVSAGISIVEGGGHMFDMLGVPKNNERAWQNVLDGYRFLFERI